VPPPLAKASTTLATRLKTRLRKDWLLVGLGAAVGLLTALGALGFGYALHLTEGWVHLGHRALPGWMVLAGPVVGLTITSLIVARFAPEARGHGVPQVLLALIEKSGRIPLGVGLTKVAASIATVASGGSAGTEGPIVQIGATTGSVVGQRLGLTREHMRVMVGCGAAGGIAAIFNAPIAGVFFALEILLRDFSLRTFSPIVVAAVFSAALTHALQGSNEAIFSASEALRKVQFTLPEAPSYIALGVVCGLVGVGFTRALHLLENAFARLRIHHAAKAALAGLILGVIGLAWLRLANAAGQPGSLAASMPSLFGNGYGTIRWLLDPGSYGAAGAGATLADWALPLSTWLLALLVLTKLLATGVTLGGGGSGGVFAPSLFLGAAAGGAIGLALQQVGLLPQGGSPAAYALVGMAAVVAATTHAPLTAILILFELTRDVYVLLPIMLAAIVATLIAQVIDRDSIYSAPIRRRGLKFGRAGDLAILRRITAATVPPEPLPDEPIYPSDPLSKLITLHAHRKAADFVVTDENGLYIGLVTGRDIRTALVDREAIPLLLVAELMRTDLPVVRTTDTLDTVLERFADDDVGSLALVGPADLAQHRTPIGLITRAAVLERYRQALDEDA